MGIETLALFGLAAFKADQQRRQANREAKALIQEGNIQSRNKAKEVAYRASKAKVSFLNSGLTLEGTPINALEGIFSSGIEDINIIGENANTRAKNVISAARTQAIMGFANVAAGAVAGRGGLSSAKNSFTFGTGTYGGFQQSLASGFDSTAMGPFQSRF